MVSSHGPRSDVPKHANQFATAPLSMLHNMVHDPDGYRARAMHLRLGANQAVPK